MNTVNSDLYIDPITNDLVIAGLNARITTDSEATAQRLKVGLQIFLGEWFLDTSFGIPYYQSVLVKNPDLNLVGAVIKKYILSVPFVVAITSFSLNFDQSKRSLTVNYTVTDSDADVISGTVTI
jgi:hypothetical protein